MSKVTDQEDRRGLVKSERAGLYPPPFLGPSREIQFYQVSQSTSQDLSPDQNIKISIDEL